MWLAVRVSLMIEAWAMTATLIRKEQQKKKEKSLLTVLAACL